MSHGHYEVLLHLLDKVSTKLNVCQTKLLVHLISVLYDAVMPNRLLF